MESTHIQKKHTTDTSNYSFIQNCDQTTKDPEIFENHSIREIIALKIKTERNEGKAHMIIVEVFYYALRMFNVDFGF